MIKAYEKSDNTKEATCANPWDRRNWEEVQRCRQSIQSSNSRKFLKSLRVQRGDITTKRALNVNRTREEDPQMFSEDVQNRKQNLYKMSIIDKTQALEYYHMLNQSPQKIGEHRMIFLFIQLPIYLSISIYLASHLLGFEFNFQQRSVKEAKLS